MRLTTRRDTTLIHIWSKKPAMPMGGFSLVELAVVVTIVGILGSIAMNSYTEYVIEGCRVDGQSYLETAANKQEQFYFDANRYAASIASLPIQATDSEGHYTLTAALIGADPNTFRITAVQSAGQTCLPANDIQYRINHTGFREHKLFGGAWVSHWE